MTVKELKKVLNKCPNNMDVFMDERLTEFKYGLVNSAKAKQINLVESEGDEPIATQLVLILSED